MQAEMDQEPVLRDAILKIAALIADGQYKSVEHLTSGRRMTASDLRDAAEACPDELAPIPRNNSQSIVVTPVKYRYLKKTPSGGRLRKYVVEAPLWTQDGNPSDLYLTLLITALDEQTLDVEVTNLGMS